MVQLLCCEWSGINVTTANAMVHWTLISSLKESTAHPGHVRMHVVTKRGHFVIECAATVKRT